MCIEMESACVHARMKYVTCADQCLSDLRLDAPLHQAKNDGATTAFMAAQKGKDSMLSLLASLGADVNQVTGGVWMVGLHSHDSHEYNYNDDT